MVHKPARTETSCPLGDTSVPGLSHCLILPCVLSLCSHSCGM